MVQERHLWQRCFGTYGELCGGYVMTPGRRSPPRCCGISCSTGDSTSRWAVVVADLGTLASTYGRDADRRPPHMRQQARRAWNHRFNAKLAVEARRRHAADSDGRDVPRYPIEGVGWKIGAGVAVGAGGWVGVAVGAVGGVVPGCGFVSTGTSRIETGVKT